MPYYDDVMAAQRKKRSPELKERLGAEHITDYMIEDMVNAIQDSTIDRLEFVRGYYAWLRECSTIGDRWANKLLKFNMSANISYTGRDDELRPLWMPLVDQVLSEAATVPVVPKKVPPPPKKPKRRIR
jgi:hypothetical protein